MTRLFIKKKASDTSSDNEQRVVQRVTMSNSELERMATSGTTSDCKLQQVTTNGHLG